MAQVTNGTGTDGTGTVPKKKLNVLSSDKGNLSRLAASFIESDQITVVRTAIPNLLPMVHISNGYHVSGIIHYIAVSLGHYKKSDAIPMSRMQLGIALEQTLIDRFCDEYPDRYYRLPEMSLDDIYGNPDIFDVMDSVPEEIKLTWMSSKNDPLSEKMWKYVIQIGAYCKMLDSKFGRLNVCFVNGDYRYKNPDVEFYTWELRFTKAQINDIWDMLLRYRDRSVPEIH